MTIAPSHWEMTPRQRRSWLFGSLVALALLFRCVPQLDLAVAGLFYDETGFSSAKEGLDGIFYWIGDTGAELIYLALTFAAVAALLRVPKLVGYRFRLVFLWAALLIGPGLVVNLGLKQWVDRPRPTQVADFGGTEEFRAAFDLTPSGGHGHSFPSGHAAFAFFLMALGWVQPRYRRRWLLASIVAGAVMGLTRMDAGAHFLSDIVFAFYAIYGSTTLAWWAVARVLPPDRAK